MFFLMIFCNLYNLLLGKIVCHGRVMPTMFSRQGFRCVPNLWKHSRNMKRRDVMWLVSSKTQFWLSQPCFVGQSGITWMPFPWPKARPIWASKSFSSKPRRFRQGLMWMPRARSMTSQLPLSLKQLSLFFFVAKLSGANSWRHFPTNHFWGNESKFKKKTHRNKNKDMFRSFIWRPPKIVHHFFKMSLAIYAITENKPTTKVSRSKYQFVKSHVVGPGCWIGSRSWKMGSGRSWGYLWFAMEFLEWHGNSLC